MQLDITQIELQNYPTRVRIEFVSIQNYQVKTIEKQVMSEVISIEFQVFFFFLWFLGDENKGETKGVWDWILPIHETNLIFVKRKTEICRR